MSVFPNTLNGSQIVSCQIVIPYYGNWIGDFQLAEPTPIPDTCAITLSDFAMLGSVYRMSSFSGSRSVRVTGGFGGWATKTVPKQAYQSPIGVPLSMILSDAALSVGEQVLVLPDRILGQFFVIESQPGARLLREIAGPLWFVDPITGITQVIPTRLPVPIVSPFDVISQDGAKGIFEIATEMIADWMPGRTFISPTVLSLQTISLTTIVADNKGKLRVHVMASGAGDS